MHSIPLRTIAPKLPAGILYGGDYNPEQWPEEVWAEDARLMRECGVNLVSLAIFSWAKLEPTAGHYEFGWLDRVIEKLWSHGVSVCLATATASPPAWFSRAHPESLPVDANGVRMSHGSRQHYCLNSRAYRTASAALIRKLAERYGRHPSVALWHLNNEIGCHINECCCDVCAEDFRGWLKQRHGSLEVVNEAWGTAFWSQHYATWEEILPPRATPTFRNPGQVLDYKRFMSDSMRDILTGEIAAIRSVVPDAKVTTNGLTFPKQTDYWAWYRHVDIAAWDAYPDPATGLTDIRGAAFCHDLFRSLRGGQPFILMEQTTSQVNWRPVNLLKAPGQMRALSYAAMARGADGVMFFQWRASRAGAEKFHGAMVPHVGTENSRVHREVRELGTELKKLGVVAGARTKARVALVVSWENRWALELESKPMAFDYQEILFHYYFALWDLNVAVDIVHPSGSLVGYDVVIAPALYQLTREQSDNLRAFVQRGGALVMSYFSGVADERDHIWLGGYPALLRDVLGLTVEEWQPLPAGETNALALPGKSRAVRCEKFCELLQLHRAQAVATYAESWFAGRAAVTAHRFGAGEACYVATQPERGWLKEFLGGLLQARRIVPPVKAGEGVEAAVRSGDGAEFLFVINHRATPTQVDLLDWRGADLLSGEECGGQLTLEPFGVRIVRRAG
ncbi:MAG TPA: beta-galactosidase [Candidatus Didemnitutus sp.]|nr:beta-galactosidase [Candidatus Didemnitutus sp.]